MNRSRLWTTLLVFVAVIAAALGIQIVRGDTPVLGLDLQGGLSVIYATTEPAEADDLTTIRDLMRTQLEEFGIAEPDVRVEGENIIVDLPGVTDSAEAFEALQVSGIVEIRPVLQCQQTLPTPTTVPGETTPSSSVPATTVPGESVGTTPTSDATVSDESGTGTASGVGSVGGARVGRGRGFVATATPDETTTDATTSTTPTQTTVPTTTPADGTDPTGTSVPTGSSVPGSTVPPTTEPPVFGPTVPPTTVPVDTSGQITVPNKDGTELCLLGPTAGTGEVFERNGADVGIDQQTGGWVINANLRGEGELAWNAVASQCFSGAPTCPAAIGSSGRLAIVLDDVIQSAPTVNAPSFSDTVTISGAFTEEEARDLAKTINRGAFPVQVEQQRAETVSPTAGDDSLQAAIFAGLVGVLLTLLYMVAYYRKLSAVIIVGLVVWAGLVYVLSTYISRETNYAFTIAGATGIIVSIGVTVDTYIVFFERLKDEIRSGRTLVNAAPRAFSATWKTILAANTVALMSAVVLFFLSVGSVRGFALYLGMTTIADVVVFYFFTRPMLYLLAGTRWFDSSNPKSIGVGTAIGGAS